jgi:hypothetical protein
MANPVSNTSVADFTSGTTGQGVSQGYDPYTMLGRAYHMNLLFNPGLLGQMLRSMRTGGSVPGLQALQARMMPGGVGLGGFPVGLPASVFPAGTPSAPGAGASVLNSILPWLAPSMAFLNSPLGQSAVGGLKGLVSGPTANAAAGLPTLTNLGSVGNSAGDATNFVLGSGGETVI